MTRPHSQVSITPEIVAAFVRYHRRHPEWGIFHVALSDGNWWADAGGTPGSWTAEEIQLVAWYRLMTQSQRRRLSHKARG